MSIASLQRSRMSDPEAKQGPDNMIVRCNNLYCDALFIVVKSFSIAGGLPVDKLYFYTITPRQKLPPICWSGRPVFGAFHKTVLSTEGRLPWTRTLKLQRRGASLAHRRHRPHQPSNFPSSGSQISKCQRWKFLRPIANSQKRTRHRQKRPMKR